MAVSQDDKYLYVGVSTGILAYSINASTGGLTPVTGSPFGGSSGAAFALVAPSTGFLYETTTTTSAMPSTGILGYNIDKNTGALKVMSVLLGKTKTTGSGTTTDEILKGDISSMSKALQTQTGTDGYISPEDYAYAKKQWVGSGYPSKKFDETFSIYRNPKNDTYNLD